MKLNVKALALACGIVWGLAVFLLTYWYLIFGHPGGSPWIDSGSSILVIR